MVATLTVQAGDSLFSLAQRHAGDGKAWRELVAANPHKAKTRAGTFQSLVPGEKLVRPLYWPNGETFEDTGDLATIEQQGTSQTPKQPPPTTQTHVSGTMTPRAFARALLAALGAPATEDAINAIVVWVSLEGGHWLNVARYNPLNTSRDWPGSSLPFPSSSGAHHIRAYSSWADGIAATAATINQSNFAALRSALQSSQGFRSILDAIDRSPWVTGRANDPSRPYYNATQGFSAQNLDARLMGWSNKPDPTGSPAQAVTEGTSVAAGAGLVLLGIAGAAAYFFFRRR